MRINDEIRAREVRLVHSDGEQLGVMPIRDALRIAQEKSLDLVEVAPTAKPPVCRIMDYGKYRFEQNKREREARKRQHLINVKEIKLRLRIDEHDFQVKARNVLRFLKDGDKVKVTVMFRGREMSHADIGHRLCQKMIQQLHDVATVERVPLMEGRNIIMVLAPKQEAAKA